MPVPVYNLMHPFQHSCVIVQVINLLLSKFCDELTLCGVPYSLYIHVFVLFVQFYSV